MADWTVYNFECADEPARAALMDWFEREHGVSFPDERYSVVGTVAAGGKTIEAEFAWVGRYLYVTVREPAGDLLLATADLWERAAVGEFDAETGTAERVTLVLDADAGEPDEVAGGRFGGREGLGGMDVLYGLAMRHRFRFRSYSATAPTRHRGVHPDAFAAVDAVETFVGDMEAATGIEPTAEGLAFLREDPADDERYRFGETYGPVEPDGDANFGTGASAPDAAASNRDGPPEATASEDRPAPDSPGPEDLPVSDSPGREELPSPEDVLGPEQRPAPDATGAGDRGVLARLRRLLGL